MYGHRAHRFSNDVRSAPFVDIPARGAGAPRIQRAPACPPGPPKAPAPAAKAASTTAVRPEIQALRAIAVLLVLVYHLWPRTLPGGFVGVDVFFVISGFLITSLLLREIDRTGTLSLSRFWARRARRILPASLVTLLFCAIATIAVVPLNYWQQFFADMRASTEYVQNWHLASSAVDYFAADEGPSPVQHFWSLSAEEQFYIVWPVLLVVALLIVRRASRRLGNGWATGIVMGAITAISFVWSIRLTARNPAAAYFVTPTRAWEFGAGGLLAMVPAATRWPAARALLSWAGIAAILVAGFAFTDATPFPGVAAMVPVLGTLAVIQAGAPAGRWAPTPILRLRPLQFIGDISYSIYLWHWPLLIFAPFVIARCSYTSTKAVIFMLTILIAWLSKVLVEDPVRSGSFLLRRRLRWTYAFAAVATGLVLALTFGAGSYVNGQVAKAEQATARVLESKPKCFGAAARDPDKPCSNPKLDRTVVPTPIQARKLRNAPCKVIEERHRVRVCEFGTPKAKATATFALLGDSHASHWRAALAVMAKSKRWRGVSITHTSCPLSKAVADIVEPARTECIQWTREVPQWLARHPEVATVFVAAHSGGRVLDPHRRGQFAAQVAGYTDAWKALPASVKHVIVIRDTPKMRGTTLECVQRAMSAHKRAGVACEVPRSRALGRDPAAVAVARLRSPRVQTVDMTRFLCDRRSCYPVIGGALVYKDIHHLTTVYAATIGPYLGRAVDKLMASWPAGGAAGRDRAGS
jgi:peptidoglycan/LPS O-acetylase OafA/YrhL